MTPRRTCFCDQQPTSSAGCPRRGRPPLSASLSQTVAHQAGRHYPSKPSVLLSHEFKNLVPIVEPAPFGRP